MMPAATSDATARHLGLNQPIIRKTPFVISQRKLAIVTTHPIQYYAPVFRALAESRAIDLRVFYTWSQSADQELYDRGFGTEVKWDVPLRDGYPHQFVQNVSRHPGTDHFDGLQNPTLSAEIERWKPDALLVIGWSSHSHLRALRHFKGRLPVLFRGDSNLLDGSPWWRTALRRGFLRWVYSHVDVAIAVGANNRDYFAWCGLPPQSIAVVPHSVDTRRFASHAADHERRAAAWRSELGIEPGAIVILYAGKFQEKKNPGLLLDAFAGLSDQAHLVFVGQGDLEAQLKSRAAGRPNIHFLQFQNQRAMPAVYRLGDVFVLPSKGPGETWGLALNEAIASGRAVIASSKVGGARDLIHQGANGWEFESDKRDALATVLREALGRGQTGLREMGARAQLRSIAWSSEACARGIGEVVLSCRKPKQRGI